MRGRALRAPSASSRRATRSAAVTAEADQRCNACRSNQQSRGPVPLSTVPSPPARLLDQRLQSSDTLREVAVVLRLGRAGRDGDLHGRHLPWGEATIASTIRNVKVDRNEPLDLHERVAGEIRRAISEGEAKPGGRLPPAKDLAVVLGVNTNTVLRALRELRDEGPLEFRRGRGITVVGTPKQSAVIERAKELLHYARTQGYKPDELIQIIQQLG